MYEIIKIKLKYNWSNWLVVQRADFIIQWINYYPADKILFAG